MSSPHHIAGLDVSTERIGYAAPNGQLVSISSKTGADDPVRRLHDLRAGLTRAIRVNPPLPDLVVIEDYSLGMMTKTRNRTTGTHHTPIGVLSKIRLGEIGGIARVAFYDEGAAITLVNVTTLKRFATSRSDADKPLMVRHAIAHGARGNVNHDEADAFHARRMGLLAHGLATWSPTSYELDAITAVIW